MAVVDCCSGRLHIIILDEGIVSLDLHTCQLAKLLKVSLQVTLNRILHIKVDHKQSGGRLGLAPSQIFPPLNIPIALNKHSR